jgi:dipeptidase E
MLPGIIRRGVIVGSGSDACAEPFIAELMLSLTGKQQAPPATVTVTYLGTATYDLERPRVRHTGWFVDRGYRVLCPQVGAPKFTSDVDCAAAVTALREADIIIVGGGNTLYMLDRWAACGLVPELKAAAERGAVMCGGSAGAICWFDAGHSDSIDPSTFRGPMLGEDVVVDTTRSSNQTDESSSAPTDPMAAMRWEYVRVPALGFLPGLLCPHYDKTQSNGIPRADDFLRLLTSAERGICIDHWAALVVDGDCYSVEAVPDQPGSVAGCPPGDMARIGEARYVAQQGGLPGVWLKERDPITGEVSTTLAPWKGMVKDILRPASSKVEEEPKLAAGRRANPIN